MLVRKHGKGQYNEEQDFQNLKYTYNVKKSFEW